MGDRMEIRGLIEEIEQWRGGKALVLAASHLEMDLVPILHDGLNDLRPENGGAIDRLDVVIQCRGGAVSAVRRIALQLRRASKHITFIVPHHCQSAGAILTLCADEIIAGPVEIFSPVDPQLQASADLSAEHLTDRSDGAASAMSAEDIRLLPRMCRDWFGLEDGEARLKALSMVSESIFPAALSAFYRCTLEVRQICQELLAMHMGDDREGIERITEFLLHGHHSHAFPLTRDDLHRVGLPIVSAPEIEKTAWAISKRLSAAIGGGARKTEADAWISAGVITRERTHLQWRTPGIVSPRWDAGDTA